MFSLDESKILFKVMIGYNEETFHGPYCIDDSDGSNQMILTETDISSNKEAIWIKNNTVVFTDYKDNLYVANNYDNSIQKIAENATEFKAR